MIASLRGILRGKSATSLLVECGGIGYAVHAPLTVTEQLPAVGEEVVLLTEFLVRENAHSLYGFLHERERELFRQMMKTSGVGAKLVLAAMSTLGVDELVAVLSAEDVGRLAKVPGIGKKIADRLVVDFRGSHLLLRAAVQSSTDSEVELALETLGYKKAEIKKALAQLAGSGEDSTEGRVRAALRLLSPGR